MMVRIFAGENSKPVVWCFLAVMFCIPAAGWPQDSEKSPDSTFKPSDGGMTTPAGYPKEDTGGSAEEEPEDDELSLFLKTLQIDIQTAGYYELIAWCRRLGLSEKGTKSELVSRLFSHYGLEKRELEKKAGKRITITSARKTEYFTIERIDEDYILLEGNVIVEVEEPEKNARHLVKAEKIIFNEAENVMTASGNVEYSLFEEGREEKFTGKSLTFSIDSWEGVFFQGYSQSSQQIGDDIIEFRYYGDEIYRTGNDVITLKDGTITSSKRPEPYYRVQAKKIWVLAPGEWAILGASIYVGEVPLLYLPFFFRNRDKVVFHPAMGFRDLEGFFLQTTTYFLGSSEEKDDSFSFLQIGEGGAGEQKKELKGIYLRSAGEMSPSEMEENEKLEQTGTYGKIMADFYSRLGLFTGLEINIGTVKWLDSFSFLGGIARSRSIFIDSETGWYTPFWSLDSGNVASRWDSSYLGAREVPFRYGFEQSLSVEESIFSFNTNFDYYSDPYFRRDFLDRSEETNWQAFTGIELEDEEEFLDTGVQEANVMQSLDWYWRGTFSPRLASLEPFLKSLTLNKAKIEMGWKTKDSAVEGVQGLDPDSGGYVPPSNRTESSFPEKKFFFPESFLVPELGVTISGTLVNWTGPKETSESEQTETKKIETFPGKGLKNPISEPEEEAGSLKEGEEGGQTAGKQKELRLPATQPDYTVPKPKIWTPLSQNLTYNFNPAFSLYHRLDSEQWNHPGDIDFSKSYSLLNTTGALTLNYTTDVFEQFLTLNETVNLSGAVKHHYDPSENLTDTQWEAYKNEDYTANNLRLLNTASLTLKPLITVDALSKSSLSYTLQSIIFQKVFTELTTDNDPVYQDQVVDWNRDFIKSHRTSASLIWNVLDADQSLQLRYTLPPLNEEFQATAQAVTGPFTTYADWKTVKLEEVWTPQPLTLRETFSLQDFLTLEQQFLYSLEYDSWMRSTSSVLLSFFDGQLSFQESFIFGSPTEAEVETAPPLFKNPYSNVSKLKVWWFSAQFTASNTNLYELDIETEIDPETGWIKQDEKAFQAETLTFSLNVNPTIDPFWKNRMKLSFQIVTDMTFNLLRFTENTLTFDFSVDFEIHEFLAFSFRVNSENSSMYRYFRGPAEQLGIQRRSLVSDLLKSFNIFNQAAREQSFFNAKTISFSLTHTLRDWNLNLDYTGRPSLAEDDAGFSYYKWAWSLSFVVQWQPVPEIKRKVLATDEDLAL